MAVFILEKELNEVGEVIVAKSKYETNIKSKLFLVECWARDGLIDEQIAKNLGVGYSTFCLYKTQHIELIEALKRGKEVIDYEVENALLKRALGYDYDEVTKELTEGGIQVTKIVKKQIAPDTTAQIFWLKNRKPNEWRDKREVQNIGANDEQETSKLFSALESEDGIDII